MKKREGEGLLRLSWLRGEGRAKTRDRKRHIEKMKGRKSKVEKRQRLETWRFTSRKYVLTFLSIAKRYVFVFERRRWPCWSRVGLPRSLLSNDMVWR